MYENKPGTNYCTATIKIMEKDIQIPELLPHPNGSSNIEGQGYDKSHRILFIKFKHTGIYAYHDFPPDKYEKFLKAESAGSYIHKEVIPNHAYEKVKLAQE